MLDSNVFELAIAENISINLLRLYLTPQPEELVIFLVSHGCGIFKYEVVFLISACKNDCCSCLNLEDACTEQDVTSYRPATFSPSES
ncbi:hypothetical protein [Calothrix sp. PCC 6303]|uniref:hypothetical protein n=1 Tax=Calothrix sp. PCC 6303 TaxID=1170562 RepID=UPI0002A05933|nr:hypothetical protein [Calothrix sp. PCC 6303]AFZ02380.1 hypothetical protein Cal6303_3446 [Calothrix sp. PCC 6303]